MISKKLMEDDVFAYINEHDGDKSGMARVKLCEAAIQEGIEKQLDGAWWEHTGLNPFQMFFFEKRSVDEVIGLIVKDINARALA